MILLRIRGSDELRLIFLVFLFASGCQFKEMNLPSEWSPIIRVAERPSIMFVEDESEILIRDTLYVTDLEQWKKDKPLNSHSFIMIMRHEYIHAVRQRDYIEPDLFWSFMGFNGPVGWLRRYIVDRAFRLEEEKLGYYSYIQYYQELGRKIPIEKIARFMSSGYFGMIDEDDAIKWVTDARDGKWRPEKEESLEFPR